MCPISVYLFHQDRLGQDMFLTGAPGPLGRRLALLFCELAQREVEYVALSRDTTETDLKQRREITGASVQYVDQVSNNTKCVRVYRCFCMCGILIHAQQFGNGTCTLYAGPENEENDALLHKCVKKLFYTVFMLWQSTFLHVQYMYAQKDYMLKRIILLTQKRLVCNGHYDK